MSPVAGRAIELPRWYARIARTGLPDPGRDAAASGTFRIGPVTVFHADRGCAVSTFGTAEEPSGVVFDGYLFDRDRLAVGLGVCASASNAELAAAAYQRWGADVLQHLDGSYLLAVWDGVARRLLIGHDALGRHPVFYAPSSDALWFSSNILALASSGSVSREPNRLSLALLALTWWPEAGQTFFEAIHRVRPGYYLEVTRASISERKHWDPLPEDDEPWLPDAQVLEEFEPALQRAVDRCMNLDAQGIMLSGGVDSVTVAALAADYWKTHGRAPLLAVSGRTGNALSYEECTQSQVTSALGMPHAISSTPEWTEGRDQIQLSLDITPGLPSPSRVYWVGTYTSFYRWTVSQGVNVLLTGAGGDNWLAVADAHAADLMRRLRLGQLVRFVRADVATGGASMRGAARRVLWGGGIRPHGDTLWARVAPKSKARYHRRRWEGHLPSWICPDKMLREQLLDRLLGRRTPALTSAGRVPRSYYRQAVRAVSNPYMHFEFETAYHMETQSGVRLLSPYHDRRLVTFFNRISPQMLVHGGRYKGLLRPVVAKRLPGLGLENQRKHYPADEEATQLRDLRQSIDAVWQDAHFDTLGRLGVVDPAVLERDIGGTADKGFHGLARMFMLMSAERWLVHHAD